MWETSGAIKTGSFSLDLISDKKEFCQTFLTEPWLQPPMGLGKGILQLRFPAQAPQAVL